MLLMGSQALANAGVKLREPKDYDYIASKNDVEMFEATWGDKIVHSQNKRHGKVLFVQGLPPVEFEISEPGKSGHDLIQICRENPELTSNPFDSSTPIMTVSPAVILALKMSHRYLKDSPHFLKCMRDIQALRALGYTIPEQLAGDWMKKRQAETYWYKHPSLAQSKEAFFTDNVPYIYDHDTIHEAVKTFDVPAFELIKEDNAEVYTSKAKFFSMSEEIQLATVLEESYVLALERSLIPNDFKPLPLAAFKKALEKVCTSISSGYWRAFAYDNYDKVLGLYDESYVDKFKTALGEGKILPFKS